MPRFATPIGYRQAQSQERLFRGNMTTLRPDNVIVGRYSLRHEVVASSRRAVRPCEVVRMRRLPGMTGEPTASAFPPGCG